MLEEIRSPSDLQKLNKKQLNELAQEIRSCIIDTVTENGGHLSSNLGIVELTIALHKVFDCPNDKILFDVGHQCYAHKMLTGRYSRFSSLRQKDGISGFPSSRESEYDSFTAGHASTSISAALGIARARDLMQDDFFVISVIGDGALTGGMAYEALNDAGQKGTKMIVILNDNEMSISKNVGALSGYLTALRQSNPYLSIKRGIRSMTDHIPYVGPRMKRFLTKFRDIVRSVFVDGQFFEALGFAYLGPIDGHDIERLCRTLKKAKRYEKPVLLHVVTQKGKGYAPAEEQPDKYHGVSSYYMEAGAEKNTDGISMGKVMATQLCDMAQSDIRICAITAAMPQGTGISMFQQRFPERFYDVGIAEEHAITMAAGMAYMGMRPYVAIYSTFAQRAIDQLLEDVCLPCLPVTLLLDRAGLVGHDGATHQGMFDLSYLRMMPNMIISSPRDVRDLQRLLHLSETVKTPMAIRYAKEGLDMGYGMGEPEPLRVGEWELILSGDKVMILAVGRMVEIALQTSIELNGKGISCGVTDARFIKPTDEKLLKETFAKYSLVVTLEENSVIGGLSAAVAEKTGDFGYKGRLLHIGIPDRFILHASVEEQMAETGLNVADVANRIKKALDQED